MFSGLFAFLGRVMLALIFVLGGIGKLSDPAGTGQYMASVGMPATLAIPAGLFELVGGLCIVFGIFTRLWAFLLAGFCLLTALLFHRDFGDQTQMIMALKNVAMAGGFLCLFAYDQKSWSFDAYRARRRAELERQNAAVADHPAVGAG